MTSDLPANWMAFKKAMCKAKHKHFDERINEITHTNLRLWDLMGWVSPCKTPPVEEILYQGMPCTSPDQLWNALHSTLNSALDRPTDLSILGDKWESPSIRLGHHILLWGCRMPSQVLQTDLPLGQITSHGVILSVLSAMDMQAAYFYGW
jgi:hypothetical protein